MNYAIIPADAVYTKKDIHRLANESAANVIEGGLLCPLQEYIKAKKVGEFATKYAEGLKSAALTEAKKYGKSTSLHGAKVETSNTAQYDYSEDQTWRELHDELATIDARLKEREAFLKALKNPVEEYDEDGASVGIAKPPHKTGSEILKITL